MAVALALTAAVWAAAVLLAPALPSLIGRSTGLVYLVGAFVCHQIPERSFHWLAAQLPVCARCTGLYVGGAIGACVWLWARSRPRPSLVRDLLRSRSAALGMLALAALPTALTVAASWASVLDPPNAWRAVFALPLGATAGLIAGAVASKELK